MHACELGRQVGILRAVLREQRIPLAAQLLPALAHHFVEIFAHSIGYQELGVFGPAVDALGQFDFFFAERLAVRFLGVLAVGRAVADVAIDDDQLGAILHVERVGIGVCEGYQIVGVADVLDIPTIGCEPCGHIFVVGEIGVALDGDVVVVVDPAQVRKFQMPGDRRGFRGNSFHHVAVAANRPDVVVEQLESRTIEMLRQPALGDRHADAVGDALTERAGGGLNARGQAVFGMPGRLAAQLPEILDLVEREGRRRKNFAVGS